MRLTDKDRRLLLETRRDIDSAPVLIEQCDDFAFHPGLERVLARLTAARRAFVQAWAQYAHEQDHTADARTVVNVTADEAADVWRWLRGKFADHLLNPPPGHQPTFSQTRTRERILERIFPVSAATLRTAPSERQAAWIDDAIAVLRKPAVLDQIQPLVALDPVGRLESLLNALRGVHDTLSRESTEDRTAGVVLDHARRTLEQCARVSALMTEAVVRHIGRDDDLGLFIYARDPAYRVRLMANKPVDAEPGARDLNDEIERAKRTL
jgi:hypothetical protein